MTGTLHLLRAWLAAVVMVAGLMIVPVSLRAAPLQQVHDLAALALSDRAAGHTDAAGLAFRRDPARERAALDLSLDDIFTAIGQAPVTDPAARAAMLDAVAQQFPLTELMGGLALGAGLSHDNLADVVAMRLAVLWMLAGNISEGDQASIDMRGLRERVNRAAALGEIGLPPDDAGRQRLADLTLYALVVDIQTGQHGRGRARNRALSDRFAELTGLRPDMIDLRQLDDRATPVARGPDTTAAPRPDARFHSVWVRYGHNGVSLTFHPRMMFSDGTVTRDLGAAPDMMDIAASRSMHPDDWGVWERQGDEILKRFPEDGRVSRFSIPGQMFQGVPAPRALTLDGRYMALSSVNVPQGGGLQTTAAWRTFDFSPDGRFVNASGISTSAPGLAAHSLPPDERGRYVIDEYAITFIFDDGREERRLFFLFPKADGRADLAAIGIGRSVYTRR